MPKFLVHTSYTAEGLKVLQKEGATGRMKKIASMLEGAGGKLESYYFALGEDDAIIICDMPSVEAMCAVAISGSASGVLRTRTTLLMTAKETDRALKKSTGVKISH